MTICCYEFFLRDYFSEDFVSFLSKSERKKTAFYLSEEARKRFIVARGLLRCVLAEKLQISPCEVSITENPFGKPQTQGLYFNLSHSDDKMILCLSNDIDHGVDVERINASLGSELIEEMIFSVRESQIAATMSPHQRLRYFFSVWTKKEAWLKGVGCGIPVDLRLFDTESDSLSWYFFSLTTSDPYVACLATQRRETYVIYCSADINSCRSSHHYDSI